METQVQEEQDRFALLIRNGRNILWVLEEEGPDSQLLHPLAKQLEAVAHSLRSDHERAAREAAVALLQKAGIRQDFALGPEST